MNRGPYAVSAAPLRATMNGSMVGSGSSHSPSTLSRWGRPATALDERPSGRGSTLRRARIASRICLVRENGPARIGKCRRTSIPPARTTPRMATGPFAASCLTVYIRARSGGTESKPQACTIRAPDATAVAWWATYIRSTNSGSPVTST